MTHYRVFSVFFVTIFVCMSPYILGQSKISEIMPNFKTHEVNLYKKYLTNLKVLIEDKGYNKLDKTGKLEGTAKRTILIGEGQFRADSVVHRVGDAQDLISATIYTFDELYSVSRDNKGYTIDSHYYDIDNSQNIEVELSHYGVFVPLTMNGWMRLSVADNFNARLLSTGKVAANKFQTLQQGDYQGRKAAILQSTTPYGSTTKNYYDPSNDYALLGYELYESKMPPGNAAERLTAVGTITYGPSTLGYPVPVKYISSFVKPDGKIVPRNEINFLEWSRYTPQPDDFNLEKQFGVKPLPRPAGVGPSPLGGTPAAKGWGRWLWLIATVLVLVTGTLVAWKVRQRKRNQS